MIGLIAAFIIAMALSVTGTPILIRFLVMHQYGQFIRQDGPTQHLTKRGTPTMGGVVINAKTQVIDRRGEVIPHLHAVGEVTGGIHGTNRLGGNAICDIFTFGRLTGIAVAKGE